MKSTIPTIPGKQAIHSVHFYCVVDLHFARLHSVTHYDKLKTCLEIFANLFQIKN